MLKKIKMKVQIIVYKLLSKLNLIKEIYYIGSGEVLPPPLNAEEEAYYLSKLKDDEEVKSILIERNLRLVVYIARKFENTKISIEEIGRASCRERV